MFHHILVGEVAGLALEHQQEHLPQGFTLVVMTSDVASSIVHATVLLYRMYLIVEWLDIVAKSHKYDVH